MSDQSDEPGMSMSTEEKVAGAAAVYSHPLIAGAAASVLLAGETDPTRRDQSNAVRSGAVYWWTLGMGIATIALVLVWVAVAHSDAVARSCKGGADKFDVWAANYQSNDGTHWTATYPCIDGGWTTVPIARKNVP